MDRPGKQVLARAGFPKDQHRQVRRGDPSDRVEDLEHLGRMPHDLLEAVEVVHPLAQLADRSPLGRELGRPADDDAELVEVQRLLDVVERPLLESPAAGLDRRVGRDEDDLGARRVLDGGGEDLQAALRLAGQDEVGDDYVEPLGLYASQGRGEVVDDGAGVAHPRKALFDGLGVSLFVLDDQYVGCGSLGLVKRNRCHTPITIA